MSEFKPAAIVGLGLMGEVYASRLLRTGIPVVGFDIDPARRQRLDAIGGRSVASISELARPARCVLLAVFNTDQVEDVVDNHLMPALGDDSQQIVVCMSTCDPDRVSALGKRVASRGLRFLDLPVSGTSEQVRQGDGVGLIGGDRQLAEEIKPVLDALFARTFHVGGLGDGGRAKLAINLILALNRLALAEGLAFAERLGLDPAAFLPVAQGSAAYSQVMDTKGPKMVRGDFTPEGRARQTLKDAYLMREQGRAVGQVLSMLNVHIDVLESCVAHDEGELDNSVVFREVRRRRK
jgi:3-hydroxyisobutyrate dehydrogenase-like beta-hydroxyacid dehydrogenase